MRRRQYYIKLTLRGEVSEERPEFSFFQHKEQTDLCGLLRIMDAARKEKRVQALLLVIKDLSIGWEQIEEFHCELDRFHRAGKRTLAYLEGGSNKSYYLACGAQEVYLPPSGHLELVGLRVEILFFKNLLDYLGIEPQLFSLGEYKSAAEIFTREGMSEASRRMTDTILSDLQGKLQERIAAGRSVNSEKAQEWIDHGPYTARQALAQGLIDGLRYQDELEESLKTEKPALIEQSASKLPSRDGWLKKLLTFYRPQIAYLVTEGIVSPGDSRRGRGKRPVLGADTVAGFLAHARKNKRVKAVVLRVNSPGGSALGSDLLWREIRLTDQQKPVIVSFGNLAASGGYYIATAARRILALPSSLTGSIGVISGKFNLQKLLHNIGIQVDSLEKGRRSGYLSPARPFSKEETEVVLEQMREFYEELFLKKVAEGRKKTVAAVRALAEGQVWTGSQALEHGLLDQLGGISDAMEAARREAGIAKEKEIRIIHYMRRRSLRDFLSLPLFETMPQGPVLFLMPEEWILR